MLLRVINFSGTFVNRPSLLLLHLRPRATGSDSEVESKTANTIMEMGNFIYFMCGRHFPQTLFALPFLPAIQFSNSLATETFVKIVCAG